MNNINEENKYKTNEKLISIRDSVRRIVLDSQKNNPYPLDTWEYVGRYLYYVLDLGSDSLRNIRLHTEIFNGEPVTSLLFSGSADEAMMASRYGYHHIIQDLPEHLILEEPDFPAFQHELYEPGPNAHAARLGHIGFKIQNRRLTPDIVRYQMYFRNLYNLGIIEEIEQRTENDRFVYLEIGAGYGCLPYQLLSRNRGRLSTIIVDLPLMLIFTACYLAVNIPDLNLYIFDPDRPNERPDPNVHDVILIPNYRLDLLKDIDGIDLAFNSLSMQEMDEMQIDDYLDFLAGKVRGGFYYHGTSVLYGEGTETSTQSIVSKIADRFDIKPSLEFFKGVAYEKAKQGAHGWPVTLPYEFYALSKSKEALVPVAAHLRVGLTDGTWGDVTLTGEIIQSGAQTAHQMANTPSIGLLRRGLRKLGRILSRI